MKARFAVVGLIAWLALLAAGQELQPGREKIPGAESLMGMVRTPAGYAVRVFVTRPEKAPSGRL